MRWLAIVFVVLSSCATKKIHQEEKESITSKDSIVHLIREVDTVFMPQESDFIIQDICDSLTGRLKKIRLDLNNANSRVQALTDQNGNLRLILQNKGSVKKEKEIYQSKTGSISTQRIKTQTVLRYRTHAWNWALHGVLLIILILKFIKFK